MGGFLILSLSALNDIKEWQQAEIKMSLEQIFARSKIGQFNNPKVIFARAKREHNIFILISVS